MIKLFESSEWSFDDILRMNDEIAKIAHGELKLDTYPNQIEIIDSEQMVDAYSSIGLPIMYHHWSFGKRFSQTWNNYRNGYQGLAYEIVINSKPCISYLMEQNSSTMQALVIAHAAYGHNHFFKNNYLFREWTDADGILDYLVFAKNYIEECEQKEGKTKVELFLNSCHSLMNYGINRYKKPRKLRVAEEKERKQQREAYNESRINELYKASTTIKEEITHKLKEPEENILYYCEKNSPKLETWQRECIRIVRKLAEYFYPQPQTKVMNEGCATVTHHKIMTILHKKGMITDGSYLEFLASHSSVVYQPDFNSPRYSGLNPYKLGQEIFRDIERMCLTPTAEDKDWCKDICNQDPREVFLDIVKNYRDESFIRQFLSPKVIRDMKLFHLLDKVATDKYYVHSIHNDSGYNDIRNVLALQHEREAYVPKIEIVEMNPDTRSLYLVYTQYNQRTLSNVDEMLTHVSVLWGGPVRITDNFGKPVTKLAVEHSQGYYGC